MKTALNCPNCGHLIATFDMTGAEAKESVPSAPVVAQEGGQWPVGACPKHGPEHWDVSKFGGMYCKAKDDSQAKGYCVLKSGYSWNGKRIPAA
jgi:hypothetical protein